MVKSFLDSYEEDQFYIWLEDAKKAGLVSDVLHHPPPFKLSEKVNIPTVVKLKTKTKVVDRFLLHPHSYTADFSFKIHKELPLVANGLCWVDVKGSFSRFHDAKSFSINQKWVFNKYGIYINKVVPEKFFKKTFVPDLYRFSPVQKKPIKKYIGCKTVDSFVRGLT